MRRSPLPLRIFRPDRRLAWSAAFLVLALGLLGFAGEPLGPEAEARWLTTRALASGGMAIEGNGGEGAAAPLPGEPAGRRSGEYSDPGQPAPIYASAPLGAALLAVPMEWLARLVGLPLGDIAAREISRIFHSASGAFWLACIAGILVLAARRLGAERSAAWWGALAFAICTWAGPASRGGRHELPAAFLLLLGFHLVLRTRFALGHLTGVSRGELLAAGLALGLSGWVHPLAWAPALLILAAAEVELRKGPRTRSEAPRVEGRWILAPFTATVLIGISLNWWRFGSALDFGGGGPLLPAEGSEVLWDGLALLISPGRGLLVFAPGVLLAVVGWQASRARGERSWSRVAAVSLGMTWLLAALAWSAEGRGWSGGATSYGFGPPHLLLVLPILWLGVPLGWRRLLDSESLRMVAATLLAAGLYANLPGILVDARAVRHQAQHVVDEQDPWDPSLASPLAHWRLVRRWSAGLEGPVPAATVFGPGREGLLPSGPERLMPPRSLGWWDLEQRHGLGWLGGVTALLLGALGSVLAILGLSARAH